MTTATAPRTFRLNAAELHLGDRVTFDHKGLDITLTVFDMTVDHIKGEVALYPTNADIEAGLPRDGFVLHPDAPVTVTPAAPRTVDASTAHEDHTARVVVAETGTNRLHLVKAARDLVVAYAMTVATHGSHSAHLATAWNRYSAAHLAYGDGAGTGRSIAEAAAHAARLLASYTA